MCHPGIASDSPSPEKAGEVATYEGEMKMYLNPSEKVVYIDNRVMFVEVARDLGIRGIIRSGYEVTRTALDVLGFSFKS
jgi:hypothetical protein